MDVAQFYFVVLQYLCDINRDLLFIFKNFLFSIYL